MERTVSPPLPTISQLQLDKARGSMIECSHCLKRGAGTHKGESS
jgi:hypothetical protein